MKPTHRALRYCSLMLLLTMLFAFAAPALAAATANDIGASTDVTSQEGGEAVEITPASGKGQLAKNAYLLTEANAASKKIVMLSKNIVVTYKGELNGFMQVSYTNSSGKTYEGFLEKASLTAVDEALQGSGAAARAVNTGGSTASASIASAMEAAKKKNSDVIGYISIGGTNIQQPILFKSGDVHYYSSRGLDGKKDKAGMVYSFYNALYRNNTITGHNMRGSNRLFHQLHHLQEKALGYSSCQHSKCPARDLSATPDIRNAANRVWDISLLGYNKWEVWAMYEVKKDEPKETLNYNINPLAGQSDTKVQEWINTQLGRSELNFGTSVSTKDSFLTIYTCGTEYDSSKAQSRLYYFLKAVK